MSGAVKQRTAPPSSHAGSPHPKGASNGSATLSYPAEASDDVNMNEVDGLVSLDVTLPDGRRMDITVDYNTPMLDLLVCLAGKSKLSPSGLLLQLLSEDTGATLTYKPNQVIGALGGRQVRLLNKKEKETNKNKNKSKKPFEMTNRFTINLPRGQKTVVRVSPAMTLGQLMTSVCQDKDLDPRRHFLQLPSKPGIPIDMNTTVGQLGVFEISLVSNSSAQERSIANSMPDLSQVPTYMPGAGDTKKKRGFLSFLKKDRKFKPHDTLYETSSTASHRMSAYAHPAPTNQRRVSDTGFESSRPKSMFVASNPNPTEFSLPPKDATSSQSQEQIAPTRKKRKAPAPPAPIPASTSENASLPKQDINANDNKAIHNDIDIGHDVTSSNQKEATTSAMNKSQSAHARADMLSRLHSRNSSDSSGYHELTLSGCESPEAGHALASKSKTSIDSASIESSDVNNGADSGIHESPVRVSPIEEVMEKPDSSSHPPYPENGDSTNYAIRSATLPLPSRKKKKAPAPPAPSVQHPPTQTLPTHNGVDSSTAASTPAPDTTITTKTITTTADLPDMQNQSVQESRESTEQLVSSSVALSIHDSDPTPLPPTQTSDVSSVSPSLQMNEDPDLTDEDIDAAFDINDILDGVTFDDEPKGLEIKTFSMLNHQANGDVMMVETSSIASENIEQMDTGTKSDRPCAFIPPPPPTEPPPPEVETVNMTDFTTGPGPVLIDKGTEVNDNASLAPASIKNSPEPVSPDGYKNEMALFVERMSKMAVDSQEPRDGNALNDSLSSGLSLSETNSDTGSVIQHLRTDSGDSRSGLDSGSWSKKDSTKINDIQEAEEHEEAPTELRAVEEISVPVSMVPPPPEFDDTQEKHIENKNDDNNDDRDDNVDDEEEYTETIEELVIPLGPNGFDFTAARKVSNVEQPKEPTPIFPQESDDTSVTNGVFRAEPVSIKPLWTKQEEKKRVEEKKTPVVQEKEEFILTTDDLSNVSFLPPRRKPSTSQRTPRPVNETSSSSSSSTVLIMDKIASTREEESSTESIHNRMSQLSFNPTTEPENDSVLEVKPISLLNRPTMRASVTHGPPPVVEDNHFVSIAPTSNAPEDQSSSKSLNNYQNKEVADDAVDGPGSRASAEGLDSQHEMLQTQFAQWQKQLATNQSMLNQATSEDIPAEQLQQLTAQMAMQQNMMLQIQSTMQSLQIQQGVNAGHGDKAASVDLPSLDMQQAAAAAEPPAPPPPPPPPAAAPGIETTKTSDALGKAGLTKAKSRPKPKFERELDPREQLMIAIKTFSGREGLKSVSKKDTKWIHSNR